MKFSKKKYKIRLADTQIEKYLKIFSAISIEGPKPEFYSYNHTKC